MLRHFRRRAGPVAVVTYASFFLAMVPPGVARAKGVEGNDPSPPDPPPATEAPASRPEPPTEFEASMDHARTDAHRSADDGKQVLESAPDQPSATGQARTKSGETSFSQKNVASSAPSISPYALPTGADKTGVSSQAISVPSGAGKLQGMGESFSAQLSTGIATFTVPIALPAARGAAQPSLALSYSSAGGQSIAGMGWSIGVPSIARQTDRGIPKYNDPAPGGPWHAEQDRFVFNGGQELVPICQVVDAIDAATQGPDCLRESGQSGKMTDERMPDWSPGWQYFRSRVEASFQRFFWAPDHKTWRVQDKSGVTMELGVPLDGSGYSGALEVDPERHDHIFRWNLSREYDAHVESSGAKRPLNVVAFRYRNENNGEEAYLTDIFDTAPADDPTTPDLSTYAHHTYLDYEARPDRSVSFRRGWRTSVTQRLARIDVASKTFAADGHRRLVHRYYLDYDSRFHVSLLSGVQIGGRCADDEMDAPQEGGDQVVPPVECLRTDTTALPAMEFGYQHVAYDSEGNPKNGDLPGYEEFDKTIHTFANSPDHSVDEELTDLFDINSDGLPDVLVTAPGLFKGKHGVFFNGFGGKPDSFTQCSIGVAPGTLNATVNDITLKNLNLSVHDIDGDGTIDLLHTPSFKSYAVHTPKGAGCEWTWQGREIDTPPGQSLKIDFGKDTLDIKSMDVNGDGLVDVVFSGGTEFQTFLSLGRYPKGDGQFGHATWEGAESAAISNDPITACVPWDGTPVHFSDPDIKLGDMNGDGLVDIVRIRKGDIRYWPGRGDGFWGTGRVDDCPAGTFGQARNIPMTESPQYSDIESNSLRLDDVNGDGLDDLVQVRFDGVDIWLNVDGASWTARHIVMDTPPAPSFANRVRLVDMNGSGTRDILWGDGLQYKYIDLAAGQRPWVLTRIANGLGKTTDITYTTSTAQMLAAELNGAPWNSKAPMPVHVVSRIVESDNFKVGATEPVSHVTEYTYRDPVYDGRQREFRGFRHAEARKIGDDNSPTSVAATDFLLGECEDEDPSADVDTCAADQRWRANGHEALKGLPVIIETSDERGTFLSTLHNTHRLRHLYTGMDGRDVRHAFLSATDSFLYDTGPFSPGNRSVPITDVELELTPGAVTADDPPSRRRCEMAQCIGLRSPASGTVQTHTASEVDRFGNATASLVSGCIDGCTPHDEGITNVTLPGRRSDDTSGWLWRTVESYVTGSAHSEKRNHQVKTYTTAGDPFDTLAELSGTLLLDRTNAAGKVSAPPPREASGGTGDPVTILLVHEDHDRFGNLEGKTGPNGRCQVFAHSEPYAEVTTSETVLAGQILEGQSCGATPLTTSVSGYDRGFGVPTEIADLHGEPTLANYDEFGRIKAITRASPYVTAGGMSALSAFPSVKVEYFLPAKWQKTPFSRVRTLRQDGPDHDASSYHESWDYIDGLGRTRLTLAEADPNAGDGGTFVASGFVDYDAKGAARRAFLPFFTGDPPANGAFPLNDAPATPYGSQRYDAFGRQIETFGLDGALTLRSVYHARTQDKWDAADLSPGPHQGTPASYTSDGHGRVIVITERVHNGTNIEARETRTTYLPTGEVETIKRHRVGGTDPDVIRWMRYDTLGRMVLNAEPHTTKNFQSALSTPPDSMHAWRYAYNDSGWLVGTSDARGCGVNYGYDAAGRILFEDYSPCTAEQEDYSPPNTNTRTGIEVLYHYDDIDAADAPPSDPSLTADPFPIVSQLYLGRLAWVADRASHTVSRYDSRGRITGVARRIAKPGPPALALSDRYGPRWYLRRTNYDGADRPIRESTGASVIDLLGTAVPLHEGHDSSLQAAGNTSVVTTEYSGRGTLKGVGGGYGDLVTSVTHAADGLLGEIKYGDKATTTTARSYDDRRRLSSVQTYRHLPDVWTNPPPGYQPAPPNSIPPTTFQLLLQDNDFTYDAVDNPSEIRDWRIADEWPDGAKPVTRKIEYDDLYRVAQIDYQYPGGDDAWISPFAAENAGGTDPRRAQPSPHVSFDKRIQRQTFEYDWLGNTSKVGDDANGFYDRSLGVITNGSGAGRPYQLSAASNEALAPSSPRRGRLSTTYDDAGNLIRLAVIRKGTCLPQGSDCAQLFAYDWDEVGRLVDARRWDVGSTAADTLTANSSVPSPFADAHLHYRYDVNDARVVKTAIDDRTIAERSTIYVFASLELRRADTTQGDYDSQSLTEVPYLAAHGLRVGRVVFEPADVPALDAGRTHVFLELGDQLGSTTTVLDKTTSELVEEATYQAYGGTESDYRPVRWAEFREDYRFTGKEEDVEVGLTYFGKRFLAEALGRWASADPLAVHEPKEADLNLYAYVHGRLLIAVDPVGLADESERRETVQEGVAARGERAAAEKEVDDLGGKLDALEKKELPNALENLEIQKHTEEIGTQEEPCCGFYTPESRRQMEDELKNRVSDAKNRVNAVKKLIGETKEGLKNATSRLGKAEERFRQAARKLERLDKKTPLKEMDIDKLKNFNPKAPNPRIGDGLEGHEVLQNAWLKVKNLVTGRGSKVAANNPALALGEKLHGEVSAIQQQMGLHNPEFLKTLSAREVIRMNAEAMGKAGVPNHVIEVITDEAMKYAHSLGLL